MTAPARCRPHGRVKYNAEGCRCEVCRAGNREYERARTRQRAYGIDAYVDAGPVRAHVAELQSAGLGIKRIAELAGVNGSVLKKLLYGDQARGQAPLKRMRPENARAILAVRPSLDLVRDQRYVDGTGTRRRLQALVALGWSQAELARRIPMQATNLSLLLRADNVQARTARTVQRIYDELCWTPAPTTTASERNTASRARAHAARRGWAPPLAWDDETIDDPAAKADVGDRRAGRPSPIDVDELIREHGRRPDPWRVDTYVEQYAQRHGVQPTSVKRAIERRRATDPDLWLAS